jgi:hypothetical protein
MILKTALYLRGLLACSMMVVGLTLGASSVRGQPQVINQEPEIKAKIVSLLRKLWEWPPDAAPAQGAPFKIGIVGNDPFQQGNINHLDRILSGERNVSVQRFENVDAYQPCHMLVVSQAADLAPALQKTRGQSVLVIAQAPGLAQQGAVMNLPIVQNRVRMEINLKAAKAADLTPNPGLLRSATLIQ